MVFILQSIGVTGDILQCGIFPVEVEPVCMKVVGELLEAADKFAASAVRSEYIGAGSATAPATQGKDHFQVGALFFQGDQVLDDGRVIRIVDGKTIAFQMTEAENNMSKFVGSKTVDGGVAAGIVADDGEFFWGAGGNACCGLRTGCQMEEGDKENAKETGTHTQRFH